MNHDAHQGHDWDRHAQSYDEVADLFEPEYSKATQAMLDAVDAKPGMRVLDLACGPGHTAAAAKARGAQALGIDKSPEMIAAARRRFPSVEFAVGDMLEPPEGPWHAVVCRMGAHHAPPAWAEAAYGVLRPGGRLAIAELGDDHPRDHDNGMRDPGYWGALLQGSGFVDLTLTSRRLRLRALAAQVPTPQAHQYADRFYDRPIHIVAGCKPADR